VVTIEETLRKIPFGALAVRDAVNLERALRLPARLDGHPVQGHAAATGAVVAAEAEAAGRLARVRAAATGAPHLIPVGSVAVDGINLTVAGLPAAARTLALLPDTLEKRTAAAWQRGPRVNLEFDLLGKDAPRWMVLGAAEEEGR